MKTLLTILFLFIALTPKPSYSQRLEVGTGLSLYEKQEYPTPIYLDTLVLYQRDMHTDKRIVFSVRYVYSISNNIDLSLGVQTHNGSAGLAVEKPSSDPLYSIGKKTSSYLTEYELPFTVRYKLTQENNVKLEAFAGIIPIFNRIKFDPRFEPGPDYPASIAEGLNKAGTLPKRFHMDYMVGGRLSYWRINLDVYYQSNITGNLNNNLEIWGYEFLFRRRTESVRFLLSYSIPLGAKE